MVGERFACLCSDTAVCFLCSLACAMCVCLGFSVPVLWGCVHLCVPFYLSLSPPQCPTECVCASVCASGV